MRDLHSITEKGKADEIGLAELVWRRDVDATVYAGTRPKTRAVAGGLRLKYRDQEMVRRRENDSVAIGRDVNCDLVVDDDMASRNHCTIERRQDKFWLKDHSTNGTYVTFEGDAELLLQREEVTLRKHGWISFGHPREPGIEVIEFFCDD